MSLLSTFPVKPFLAPTFPTSLYIHSNQFHTPVRICAKRFNRIRSWCTVGENRKSMAGLIGVRGSNSEEDVGVAFEQEAFIEGAAESGGGGVEATLNTMSKWIVSLLFGGLILLRHDGEASWAATGAVFNAMLSVSLKKLLNQERPIATLRSDPGMPSSHGQSIFYILTFVNISLVEWFGINGLTAAICGLFTIAACYFSWLRVSQQLHTISQIVVGAVIGFIFSMFWFWTWNYFVLSSFESYLWVRILVILGSVVFSLAFVRHVYKSWIKNER